MNRFSTFAGFFLALPCFASAPKTGALRCLFELARFAEQTQIHDAADLGLRVASGLVDNKVGIASDQLERLKQGQVLAEIVRPLLDQPAFADVLGEVFLKSGLVAPEQVDALREGDEATILAFAGKLKNGVLAELGPSPLTAANFPLAKSWGYSVESFRSFQQVVTSLRTGDLGAAFAYLLFKEPERIRCAVFGPNEEGLRHFAPRQLKRLVNRHPQLARLFNERSIASTTPFHSALAEQLAEIRADRPDIAASDYLKIAIDHSRADLALLTIGVSARLIYFAAKTARIVREDYDSLTLAVALGIVCSRDKRIETIEAKLTANAPDRIRVFKWLSNIHGPQIRWGFRRGVETEGIVFWSAIGFVSFAVGSAAYLQYWFPGARFEVKATGGLLFTFFLGPAAGLLGGWGTGSVSSLLSRIEFPLFWQSKPAKTSDELKTNSSVEAYRAFIEQ